MRTIVTAGLVLGMLCMGNMSAFAQQKGAAGVEFTAVKHASFVMTAGPKTIYVDPTGSAAEYGRFRKPDIILITHGHPDHFDKNLIAALKRDDTVVVGPKSVINALPFGKALGYGESVKIGEIGVEAVPAYNTTPDRLKYHPKGEGNGYLVTAGGKRTYIAGDTEDMPEMRKFRNIDYAFIPMNLPYTMTPEQAASAVLEFKPKVVFPYHYRQPNGFADVARFKELVAKGDRNIEVRTLPWYK